MQPLTSCDMNNLIEENKADAVTSRGRRSSVSGAAMESRSQSLSPVPSSSMAFLGPEDDVTTRVRHRPRADAVQLQTPVELSSLNDDDKDDVRTRAAGEPSATRTSLTENDFWFLEKYQPDSENKVCAQSLCIYAC